MCSNAGFGLPAQHVAAIRDPIAQTQQGQRLACLCLCRQGDPALFFDVSWNFSARVALRQAFSTLNLR